MTHPRRHTKLRWLGLVLSTLTVVLVAMFGAGNPSAAAAQSRVGAPNSEAKVVEPHGSIHANRRVRCDQSTYGSMSAALPAAEDPVAAVSRAALWYGYGAALNYDASLRCADVRTVVKVEAAARLATVVPLGRQVGAASEGSVAVSGFVVAAKSVPKGIIYRRTDLLGGKPYIGQAKSESRYLTRQSEHARAHPDADFEFEIIGRSNRGVELDRMEEFFIRGGGGPTNLGNPSGGLANLRHQMSDPRYRGAGGDLW